MLMIGSLHSRQSTVLNNGEGASVCGGRTASTTTGCKHSNSGMLYRPGAERELPRSQARQRLPGTRSLARELWHRQRRACQRVIRFGPSGLGCSAFAGLVAGISHSGNEGASCSILAYFESGRTPPLTIPNGRFSSGSGVLIVRHCAPAFVFSRQRMTGCPAQTVLRRRISSAESTNNTRPSFVCRA
jgi:hypothetical protein